jgi:hypothetical protein
MSTLDAVPDIAQMHAHSLHFSQTAQDVAHAPPPNDPYDGFSWAMVELGVHEPLPPLEVIDEL